MSKRPVIADLIRNLLRLRYYRRFRVKPAMTGGRPQFASAAIVMDGGLGINIYGGMI